MTTLPLLLVSLASAPLASASEPARTIDECVAIAVAASGQVAEAQGRVAEWEARLAEVRANWYPKLTGLLFAAPMFTVTGNAFTPDVQRDYTKWGPYLRAEGMLVQPLSTFGRLEAGERAAQERLEVERARLAQARDAVALEVRRFYLLHLYAKSLSPTLENARKVLNEAQTKAQDLYASASGKVTNVDLMKLRYASAELDRGRIQAAEGQVLALAALKHTMGLADGASLVLAEQTLPASTDGLPSLEQLTQVALEKRPEMQQIRHGTLAAQSLEAAEKAASRPILGVAAQFAGSYTPTRDDTRNPYHNDPYNDLFGGVALALKFDVDPARDNARASAARALKQQVAGLERFAATGIPMEVRKAYQDLRQAQQTLVMAADGAAATRKWVVFAAAAYASGTGETKDLLEGVAANVSAKKNQLDALLLWHTSRAELLRAIGLVSEPREAWEKILEGPGPEGTQPTASVAVPEVLMR